MSTEAILFKFFNAKATLSEYFALQSLVSFKNPPLPNSYIEYIPKWCILRFPNAWPPTTNTLFSSNIVTFLNLAICLPSSLCLSTRPRVNGAKLANRALK